jgi:hypothetical protein
VRAEIVRPNPFRWLLYVYGAGLPAKNSAWVLHDATARTWVLRHLVRTSVQLLPVAVALFLLIPGEAWVRGLAVLGGLLMGYFYSFTYIDELAEHRAIKAGHPRGAVAAAREAGRADERRAQQERYVRRWRS